MALLFIYYCIHSIALFIVFTILAKRKPHVKCFQVIGGVALLAAIILGIMGMCFLIF